MRGQDTRSPISMRPKNHKKNGGTGILSPHFRGFTLIEIIMVIVLLGVMAAIVALEYAPVTRVRTRAAADKLKADMQFAQSLALERRVTCGVSFSGNTYTVFQNTVATPATDPLTKQNYVVSFNAGEYQGVTITSATFGATTAVQFDREGIPSDGSGNALPSAQTGRQVILNGSTSVIVTQTTGKVTIS